MYRDRRVGVAAACIALLAFPGAAKPDTADELAEEIRAQELASREQLSVVSPLYPLPGWTASVLMLNRSWREIPVRLDALSADGQQRTLAEIVVSPRRHLAVELPREILLSGASVLRLEYFDLADALQSYLVFEGPGQGRGQVFSQPFRLAASGAPSGEWFVTWPGAQRRREPVELVLVNTGPEPVEYRIGSEAKPRLGEIEPNGFSHLSLRNVRAPLRIEHSGRAGSLLVFGLARLWGQPVEVTTLAMGYVIDTASLTAPALPSADGALTDLLVTVSNPIQRQQSVPILLLGNEDGQVLAAVTLDLGPLETRTVSLASQWPHVEDWSGAHLSLGPAAGGLAAVAVSRMGKAQLSEVSFFRDRDVHNMGIYPVPDLESNEVRLHVVNKSAESSTVAIELSWDTGRYSLEPFELPPATAKVVSINALQQDHPPDMLGRTIPQALGGAAIKWRVLEGGQDLLGRTEVRAFDSEDRFGINCYGCCWQIPSGSIVPSSVVLDTPGVARSFQTSVLYDTCWGLDGPYYLGGASLQYSAPYSWNSQSVSASDGAWEDLSFEKSLQGMLPNCNLKTFPVAANGKVDACKIALRSSHCPNFKCDPGKKCVDQTSSCKGCNVCCKKIRQYWTCKKRRQDWVTSEYNACVGQCLGYWCSP